MPAPITLRQAKKDMRDAIRRANTLLRHARRTGDRQSPLHGMAQVGIAEGHFEIALRVNGGQITPELSRLDDELQKVKNALREQGQRC